MMCMCRYRIVQFHFVWMALTTHASWCLTQKVPSILFRELWRFGKAVVTCTQHFQAHCLFLSKLFSQIFTKVPAKSF